MRGDHSSFCAHLALFLSQWSIKVDRGGGKRNSQILLTLCFPPPILPIISNFKYFLKMFFNPLYISYRILVQTLLLNLLLLSELVSPLATVSHSTSWCNGND